MIAFVGYTLGFIALLLVLAAPVMFVSHRRGKRDTIRRFVIAAALCGLFCGVLTASGRKLESQCADQGNTSCYDAGGSGMRIVVIAGYLGASLMKTRSITRR